MILHNASDKFIRVHEGRIRQVMGSMGGSPKQFTIVLVEPRDSAFRTVLNLELITTRDENDDIVISVSDEEGLSRIEAWEERNSDKF